VVMAYFKVFHYLPRDNKKNHENFGQNNWLQVVNRTQNIFNKVQKWQKINCNILWVVK
jgi:hypothetical protein